MNKIKEILKNKRKATDSHIKDLELKGKQKWMKWFFYLYYPLHLIIIGILRIAIYGNIPLLFN